MTEVFVPEIGMVLQFPTCEVCRDSGRVETPILDWRGESYLGHGLCDCSTCHRWPTAMRDWGERSPHRIPAEAMADIGTGRALRHMALQACPFCENGRAYDVWVRTKRDRRTPAKEWVFTPKGWRWVHHESVEGRELVARWRTERERWTRGLNVADVRTAAARIGRPMPKARGPRPELRTETVEETEAAAARKRELAIAVELEELHGATEGGSPARGGGR